MTLDEQCRCLLHEPGSRSDIWDDDDRSVVSDVDEYGWHASMVFCPEGITPSWTYTTGLAHTFGVPDLVMVGLDPQHMHSWLNKVVEMIRAGRVLGDDTQVDGVLEGYTLLVRDVDSGWVAPLFGCTRWFYRNPNPPLQQLVWPDPHHRMPWDEDASQGCGVGQARLWLSPEKHPPGVWTDWAMEAN